MVCEIIKQGIIILYFCSALSLNEDTLQQIHIIFRHGERSPTRTYPNDPYKSYKWSGGLGHLTNRGKNEIYNLGITLKQRYKNFTKAYVPNEVKFLSSYADRCLMSAELLAAGLYPPSDDLIWNEHLLWQPIPISYQPRSLDNMIAAKRDCKKYDMIFKNLYASDEIKKLNHLYFNVFEVLQEYTRANITDIGVIEEIYSVLLIQELHNLTLPEWAKSIYPEPMRRIAATSLASYTYSEYMKRAKGGVFLKKMITDMKSKIQNVTMPKTFLYASHDLTLVNILRTLDIADLILPNFGAYLILELHKNPDGRNEVIILYADEPFKIPTEKQVPNCDKPCSLDDLEEGLKAVLPMDWEQECTNV